MPLPTMYVITDDTAPLRAFDGVLRDEVNVKSIECTATGDKFNTPYLTVNFKTAGASLKARVQELKNTLAALGDAEMAAAVAMYKKGKVTVGDFKNLPADIFFVAQKPRQEFVSINDGGLTVVLDTTVTDDLRDECFVRELIRAVQDARKTADLEITARIALSVTSADKKATSIIEKFRAKIMGEVLCTQWAENLSGKGVFSAHQEIEGYKIGIKFKLA
jgi:isoleucyl-tRNA synthetase